MNRKERTDAFASCTRIRRSADKAVCPAVFDASRREYNVVDPSAACGVRVTPSQGGRARHRLLSADALQHSGRRGENGQVHGWKGIQGGNVRVMTEQEIAPGDYAGLHRDVVRFATPTPDRCTSI